MLERMGGRAFLILLVVLFALAAVACEPERGGGSNGGGGQVNTGPTEIDLDEFAEDFDEIQHQAYCQALWQCPEWERIRAQTHWHYGQFDSLADCLAGPRFSIFDSRYRGVRENVEEGRIEYDAQRASSCRQAIHASLTDALCGDYDSNLAVAEACESVFVGAVAEDEYCLTHRECQPGSRCQHVDMECYGRCEVVEGVYCGEVRCPLGQYCASSADSECAPRGGPGDSCVSTSQCGAHLHCNDEVCTPERSRQAGQSCSRHNVCAPGLSCQDGSCQTEELGGEGDSCFIYDLPLCEPGLGCNVIDPGMDNISFEAYCAPRLPEGESCTWSNECQPNLRCDSGSDFEEMGNCAPRLANGEVCWESADCESLICDFDGAWPPVCADEFSIECQLPEE